MDGTAKLQPSARNTSLIDAFSSSIPPLNLVSKQLIVSEPARVQAGTVEYPFRFPLVPVDGQTLFETYHGVYVNVMYTISVEVDRG